MPWSQSKYRENQLLKQCKHRNLSFRLVSGLTQPDNLVRDRRARGVGASTQLLLWSQACREFIFLIVFHDVFDMITFLSRFGLLVSRMSQHVTTSPPKCPSPLALKGKGGNKQKSNLTTTTKSKFMFQDPGSVSLQRTEHFSLMRHNNYNDTQDCENQMPSFYVSLHVYVACYYLI